MSTRAMYTFKDEYGVVHVYKHHDGYPEGGVAWIANARNYAWPLPRFEADDFAAAFVAANKPKYDPDEKYSNSGGGVRLCGPHIQKPYEMAVDAGYHYIVEFKENKLYLTIYSVKWWDTGEWDTIDEEEFRSLVFRGTLTEAIEKYKILGGKEHCFVEELLNQ